MKIVVSLKSSDRPGAERNFLVRRIGVLSKPSRRGHQWL